MTKFNIQEVKENTMLERGFFSSTLVPVTDIFFTVNRQIPVIEEGECQKARAGYNSYCSGYSYSGPVTAYYNPATFLLIDGRYKLVLNRNDNFHSAILGLSSFIVHPKSPILERWGGWGRGFDTSHFSIYPAPQYELSFASPELEKKVKEI